MMQFKAIDRRLEGKTLLEQCQLAELYLLDIFIEICEKYNLTYFLDSGTLIGAMRHNGFIPWDDDIDIGMPVKDYRRFREIAKEVLPDNLLIDAAPASWLKLPPYLKLRDRSSFFCDPSTDVRRPCGIYIDIFAYDKYPLLSEKWNRRLFMFSLSTWATVSMYLKYPYTNVWQMFVNGCKILVWYPIHLFSRVLHRSMLLFKPAVWHNVPGAGNSVYNGVPLETYFPLAKHEFEGRMCNVPNNPDAMLTRQYGNWRELPPEDKRVWHHSILCPTQAPNAWWAKPYGGPRC